LNISEDSINCLNEVFKDNEPILYYLIRDCKNKIELKVAIELIYEVYFPKEKYHEDLNIIDLIVEYAKISKFDGISISKNNPLKTKRSVGQQNEKVNIIYKLIII